MYHLGFRAHGLIFKFGVQNEVRLAVRGLAAYREQSPSPLKCPVTFFWK